MGRSLRLFGQEKRLDETMSYIWCTLNYQVVINVMNCENKLIPKIVKLTLSISSTQCTSSRFLKTQAQVINKTDGGLNYRIARHIIMCN